MKIKKISFRWVILTLAAIGILIYSVAPELGWGLGGPFLEKTSELRRAQDLRVLAKFSWNGEVKGVLPDSFIQLTLDLNYHNSWKPSTDELQLLDQQAPVMVTLRTWSWEASSYYDNPLNDVVDGKYDNQFRQFIAALPRQGEGIFIRFNPNVEVPANQYPWQQYPRIFIGAFRRFAELLKAVAPETQMLWSPAGYPGAMEYYPGDELVDGATVTFRYGAEGALDAYPSNLPANVDLYRRLHRLRFLRVPIYALTEDGYRGELPDIDQVVSKLSAGEAGIYGQPPRLSPPDSTDQRDEDGAALVLGLYDPQERLLDAPPVDAEHIFIDFDRIRDGRFDSLFQAVEARGHSVIVTFEPFTQPIEDSDPDVLNGVTRGQYDAELLRVFSTLKAAHHPVYFRYAHEMEIPIHRYPWQSQDPQDYISSFRYVMGHDSLPPAVNRIWGPAGDRGFLEWYPGDDYVDQVSIAIYGLPDKNITDPTKQESFEVIYKRKMWRMRFVDKPVFITEFGVKGPEDYQTQWLEAAARVIQDDPRVVGINYFNMSDTPKAWGEIKPPDWSITEATLDRFINVLETDR